ncbi:MAG: MFS transporter [Alphaproteobacteria bacterium]|nr:MFS transporter [Alphaproteobacteria bacterium]
MKEKFQNIYGTYCNKKMLILTLLGFASGFPFLLVFSTLSLWLKDVGWSYKAIGAISMVKIPYAFKWLWSPVVDGFKIPVLWRLGRRRSWGIAAQICLFASILAMSCFTPEKSVLYLVCVATAVSFSSATLDIVLDAFRVEMFANEPQSQASGSAIFVLGYRFGLLFSGAGALMLASVMSWNSVYILMACGAFIGILTLIVVKEPVAYTYEKKEHISMRSFFHERVLGPLKDFTLNPGWKLILCLIFIYRLSDAYIGPMAYPFYSDMGFTNVEIAYVIKIYGMIATVLGGLYGGLFLKKHGIFKGLYVCVFTQGITTAFYAVQAYAGHNVPMLVLTISMENFSSGMATAALVAYMSSLCNVFYTATQYALLSSLLSVARDFFAATSGFVLELTGWPLFFIFAGLMCLPSLIILRKIQETAPPAKTSEKM